VRQGQQNRRGRGRNNNRKGHNPLARSFESNGPDVKIRGTPAHIAEKYLALSRDAQSSGDPVLAENYLQHAEHYTRIIMAYRDQLQQPGDMSNGNGQRMRPDGEVGDEFTDDESDDILDEALQPPLVHQPQPRPHNAYEGNRHEGNRHDRPYRRDHSRGFRSDRDRDRGDRHPEGRPQAPERSQAPERQQERPQEPAEAGGEQRRRERFQPPPQHEQPEFLRRPVRRTRSENGEQAPPAKEEPSRD
jgi:uncharacterized protein DUF4167